MHSRNKFEGYRYQESLEIARGCGKTRNNVGAWCLRISAGELAVLRYIATATAKKELLLPLNLQRLCGKLLPKKRGLRELLCYSLGVVLLTRSGAANATRLWWKLAATTAIAKSGSSFLSTATGNA